MSVTVQQHIEIKNEFTDYFVYIIRQFIYEGIISILNKSLRLKNNEPAKTNFQTLLKTVPNWNKDIITRETTKIKNECQNIVQLLDAVIKANIYSLCSYDKEKCATVEIPEVSFDIFIHKCYVSVARALYTDTDMIFGSGTKDPNQRLVLETIESEIRNSIRSFLPHSVLLDIYLNYNFKTLEVVDNFNEVLGPKSGIQATDVVNFSATNPMSTKYEELKTFLMNNAYVKGESERKSGTEVPKASENVKVQEQLGGDPEESVYVRKSGNVIDEFNNKPRTSSAHPEAPLTSQQHMSLSLKKF